ncbi:hypothetical protein J2T13_001397 [Paenibacillus sp. DS2015]
MGKMRTASKLLTVVLGVSLMVNITGLTTVSAKPNQEASKSGGIQLEDLDRGLVAASTSEGVFLSWRLLAHEVTGHSTIGLTGVDFNIYRDDIKIATVKDSTNFLEQEGTLAAKYSVSTVINGREAERSEATTPWNNTYYDLPQTSRRCDTRGRSVHLLSE